MGRGVLLIAAAPALAACSLSEDGVLVGPGPVDATAPKRDTGTPPCLVDCGAPDVNPRMDAPRDVAVEDARPERDAGRDAEAGSWCSTVSPTPTFCDDFDKDSPALVPPWDMVNAPGGSVVISGAQASSAPSSALASMTASMLCQSTTLSKRFGTSYTKGLELDFDLYPDTGEGVVASIIFDMGYELDLFLSGSGAVAQSSVHQVYMASYSHSDFKSYPTAGAWTRVGVKLDLPMMGPPPVTGGVAVSFNGTVVHKNTIDGDKVAGIMGGATIYLGANCYDINQSRQLYYDNVVFNGE